jgi:hypothetical protein
LRYTDAIYELRPSLIVEKTCVSPGSESFEAFEPGVDAVEEVGGMREFGVENG